jgi:hypothetical protein
MSQPVIQNLRSSSSCRNVDSDDRPAVDAAAPEDGDATDVFERPPPELVQAPDAGHGLMARPVKPKPAKLATAKTVSFMWLPLRQETTSITVASPSGRLAILSRRYSAKMAVGQTDKECLATRFNMAGACCWPASAAY